MDTTEYEDACIALKLYAEEALRKDPDRNLWASSKGQMLLAKYRAANAKLMAQKHPAEKAELMFPSPRQPVQVVASNEVPYDNSKMTTLKMPALSIENMHLGDLVLFAGSVPVFGDVKSAEPLFCKDCRWFKREFGGDVRCTHSKAKITTLDIVEGKLTTDHLYCSAMRTKGGVCGEEGRLWEAQIAGEEIPIK